MYLMKDSERGYYDEASFVIKKTLMRTIIRLGMKLSHLVTGRLPNT